MIEINKFKSIPVEKNTTIIASLEARLNSCEVVYQKWIWDGIFGESVIFHNGNILSLNEQEIKKLKARLW